MFVIINDKLSVVNKVPRTHKKDIPQKIILRYTVNVKRVAEEPKMFNGEAHKKSKNPHIIVKSN